MEGHRAQAGLHGRGVEGAVTLHITMFVTVRRRRPSLDLKAPKGLGWGQGLQSRLDIMLWADLRLVATFVRLEIKVLSGISA